ncbi:MAG TPA: enoyl-CoA hydratase-related protein, partial [Ramlibacter sp.]|nr:enoyl-CoA hydratase-related protein [Ramlibacter sp.]
MNQFENLKVEIDAGVALVTLDRPGVNAIDRKLREECTTLFSMLGEDHRVRSVVLTGAGKMFSAGADLKDRPDASQPGAYPM